VPDQPPETRHYHGADWHDHPGGDRPHDHSPLPPPVPARQHHRIHDFWAVFLVVGIIAAVVWAVTNADYTECQSALVAAFSSGCGTADTWHDASGVTAVLCAVAFLVSVFA
jgi:hypothetical protein